jgi:hypothetical protein
MRRKGELEKHKEWQSYHDKNMISVQLKKEIFDSAMKDYKQGVYDPMTFGVKGFWYYKVCMNRIKKCKNGKIARPV